MSCGLIGKTLVHSYSKEIHEALGAYTYELFSLSEKEMPEFIRAGNFQGLNVTIPYKQDVIPLCDEISDLAEKIGAVNTLYWNEGKLVGHNTDYEGFLYMLKRAGISLAGKKVLILGNGGTSLMARYAVKDQGAEQIYIASRKMAEEAPDTKHDPAFQMRTYEQLTEITSDVDVIVNTTPVGTYPDNLKQVVTLEDFPNCEAAVDVIYNPFLTKLLLEARDRGIRYTNGLPMLVAQATAAAGYFLGTPGAYEEENERIIAAMEDKMQNLVLIGMPGCGKSTIGYILSELTGKEYKDMDAEIERAAGKTIPEIFAEDGEEVFRQMETETAETLGKEKGLVISTGGGAVLKKRNVEALSQNGLVIHIQRPTDMLAKEGRPLSRDLETLEQMAVDRAPYYEAAADVEFDNSIPCTREKLETELAAMFHIS